MKVLSLTEPYATLIKEKKKLIETRSWKTNYRGELYIHASMTPISKTTKEDNKLFSLINVDLPHPMAPRIIINLRTFIPPLQYIITKILDIASIFLIIISLIFRLS